MATSGGGANGTEFTGVTPGTAQGQEDAGAGKGKKKLNPPAWMTKNPLRFLGMEIAQKLSYAGLCAVTLFALGLVISGIVSWQNGSSVQDALQLAPNMYCQTRAPNGTTVSISIQDSDINCHPKVYAIPDNTPPFWISACAGGVSMILAGFGFFGTKKKNMSMLLVYITLELVVSLVVILLSVQMLMTLSCIEHTNGSYLNAACKTYFQGLMEVKPLPSFLQTDEVKWDSVMQKIFTDVAARQAIDWSDDVGCDSPSNAATALSCSEDALAANIKAPASMAVISCLSGLFASFCVASLRTALADHKMS